MKIEELVGGANDRQTKVILWWIHKRF
jgi:hypothetical protein